MKGRTIHTTESRKNELNGRYLTVLASLRSLTLELEGCTFKSPESNLWHQRSIAVGLAFKALMDAKTPPVELTKMGRPKRTQFELIQSRIQQLEVSGND